VLQRRVRGRVQLTNGDRLFLVQLYQIDPPTGRRTSEFRSDVQMYFWVFLVLGILQS
jgi:hypothetical protein